MAEDSILSPRQVLESFEQKFIDAFHKSLEKHDRVSGGGLWQSVKAQTKVYGQKVTLEITMADYWKWVENGRKAGGKQPPIEPILKFIANRGLTLKSKGLDKKGKKGLNKQAQYRSLAFVIARSIKKRGIKATHFGKEVMESSLIAEMTASLLESVGREIKVSIGEVIET